MLIGRESLDFHLTVSHVFDLATVFGGKRALNGNYFPWSPVKLFKHAPLNELSINTSAYY